MSINRLSESQDLNLHLGSKIYISDLLRIEWNYSMRWDVLLQYLEASKSNSEIYYSVPAFITEKALVLLTQSTFFLVSSTSILLINCSEDLQILAKKTLNRPQCMNFTLNLAHDPYLIISICTLFFISDSENLYPEEWITKSDAAQGKMLLKAFIYQISEHPKSIVDKKLQEMQNSKVFGEITKGNSKSQDMLSGNSHEIEYSDMNYEENVKKIHEYHRTWQGIDRELYKVTEYNESLECSVSKEPSEAASKANDFSSRLTGSIVDKFPKFSIASLSISDSSFHNAYDLYKKSYLEYIEPLEIVNYYSPEISGGEFYKKDRQSPYGITTNAMTLSDSNTLKDVIETKPEYCACPKCMIF